MVLHRILQWLRDNYARTVDLFHKLDSNQDNYLSCDEFVTGMRMLEVGNVLQMQQKPLSTLAHTLLVMS